MPLYLVRTKTISQQHHKVLEYIAVLEGLKVFRQK